MYLAFYSIATLILFAVQLLLCLHCKYKPVQWIPLLVCCLVTAGFLISAVLHYHELAFFNYWVTAKFSLFGLAACGFGWVIALQIKR